MKLLIQLFFLFCFFPYVDIFNIGTDTQPNALLLAGLFVFTIRNKKINTPIIFLWVIFGLSLFLGLDSKLNLFFTLKNLLNYLAPALICLVAYNLFLKTGYKFKFATFFLVVLIYFIVGIIQMYFVSDFMTFLVNQGARGIMFGGRGVVSLCPEPAFYGSMCLFLMIFSLINYSKKENLTVLPLLLFQILFLSKSATVISILIVATVLFVIIQIFRFKLKYCIVLVFSFLAFNLFFVDNIKTFNDSRVGILFSEFLKNPLLIAQVDPSASVRLTGSISFYFVIKHNSFLPMGFGRYQPFLEKLYSEGYYRKLITKYSISEKDRLGGGINMILFHLGFLGLFFPIAIVLSFRKLIAHDKYFFCLVLFILLLFTQIQLMHAMIGLIMASAIYMGNLNRIKTNALL